jgi:hypothetical protein
MAALGGAMLGVPSRRTDLQTPWPGAGSVRDLELSFPISVVSRSKALKSLPQYAAK